MAEQLFIWGHSFLFDLQGKSGYWDPRRVPPHLCPPSKRIETGEPSSILFLYSFCYGWRIWNGLFFIAEVSEWWTNAQWHRSTEYGVWKGSEFYVWLFIGSPISHTFHVVSNVCHHANCLHYKLHLQTDIPRPNLALHKQKSTHVLLCIIPHTYRDILTVWIVLNL